MSNPIAGKYSCSHEGDERCHIGSAMTSKQGKSVFSLEPYQEITFVLRGLGHSSPCPQRKERHSLWGGRLTKEWTETAHFQGQQLVFSVLHAHLTAFFLSCDSEGTFCFGHGRSEDPLNHPSRDAMYVASEDQGEVWAGDKNLTLVELHAITQGKKADREKQRTRSYFR